MAASAACATLHFTTHGYHEIQLQLRAKPMSDPTAGPASPIQYVVEGGHRLSGTIAPAGNKNAALPIIAAALLTEHPVTLRNVPRIRDTETLVELIRSVGASAEWRPQHACDPRQNHSRRRSRSGAVRADPRLDPAGRAAAGPLRRGDAAAARRRRHRPAASRHALSGVRAARRQRHRHRPAGIPGQRLTGADVFLDEPSVTATENALMAAVAAHGTTYLRNAASEPHVQDLAHFLVALGARHRGHRHQHHGRARAGDARRRRYSIGPDHIEVGSLIGLAAVTRSPLRIARAGVEHLRSIRMGFERLGIVCDGRRRRPRRARGPDAEDP